MIFGLLKTMRPKQWTKNLFIFGALIFDGKLLEATPLLMTVFGFALLCLISGTVYVINDLVDLEKDRLHPKKRNRPLASGQISKGAAIVAAVILPAVVLPLGFWLSVGFGLILFGYLGLQIAYSFYLKNVVIVDVLAVAAGFVLRVGAGVSLITVVRFSPWLYVCTTLLALFLVLGKRRQELVLMGDNNNTRSILEHYNRPFLDQMISIVTASTVMAYSLYTFSAEGLPQNHLMMLTIPFVIYGIFRWLYVIHVQGNGGAPDEVVLQDRPLQISLILWAGAVVLILYVI
ncbi:MAG: decaprenyl-phosphate phosphoribosyltransferase [Anaerolineae bacterium]